MRKSKKGFLAKNLVLKYCTQQFNASYRNISQLVMRFQISSDTVEYKICA